MKTNPDVPDLFMGEFATFAKNHGGFSFEEAGQDLMTDDGIALPTFRSGRTEVAWRAWHAALAYAQKSLKAPASEERREMSERPSGPLWRVARRRSRMTPGLDVLTLHVGITDINIAKSDPDFIDWSGSSTGQVGNVQIEWNPSVAEILGRPNFMCGGFASRMRSVLGTEIPTKAEAEQARVVHLMLNLYLKHGVNEWAEEFNKVLKLGEYADKPTFGGM